jgi:hypothetical protein
MKFADRQQLIKILAAVQPELLGMLTEKDLDDLVEARAHGADLMTLLDEAKSKK